MDVLAKANSLLYDGFMHGFDNCLEAMNSGSTGHDDLSCKYEELFSEHLQPGLFSEADWLWLEQYRGQPVAVLIAQCPQRDATFQVAGDCKTNANECVLA